MQYSKNRLYKFVREEKVVLGEEFEDRKKHFNTIISFLLKFKVWLSPSRLMK
jgi:hypothetical protein